MIEDSLRFVVEVLGIKVSDYKAAAVLWIIVEDSLPFDSEAVLGYCEELKDRIYRQEPQNTRQETQNNKKIFGVSVDRPIFAETSLTA